MAFNKYANAQVVKPAINLQGWAEIRQRAALDFKQREAAKVVLPKYDPKEFLLSHCTIIASVDTEKTESPLGKMVVDNFHIERKYSDYRISADTQKYVNNNNDCWERKLLLASFPTFTGGENYVEHIQIPELSKGKIIDAAARDIGDSIYVDILVATNRKHRPLIAAISNGSLSTLSMGCQVQFTICTKCGNVAYDETQLCPHIKYQKGNDFFDEFGQKRKIAELCGHINEEPGSVRFIEASWVANPAFPGAVLRNILSPEEVAYLGGKFAETLSEPVRTPDLTAIQKAANLQASTYRSRTAQFGMDDVAPDTSKPKEDEGGSTDPIKKVVDDLADTVREHVTKRIREDIGKSEAQAIKNLNENQNDTLIKSALEFPEWREIAKKVLVASGNRQIAKKILTGLIHYKSGGWTDLVKTGSFSGRELLSVARMLDLLTRRSVKAGDSRLYRTVIAVGGMGPYRDIESYLAACRQVVGRDLSSDEVSSLIDRGRLFNLGS